MLALIRCTQLLLVLLTFFGFYSTWYLAGKNGTIELMEQIRDHGPQLLPGTNAPLKRTFTGVEAIDYRLTVLIFFFWEQVDGSMPNGSLFCFMFAGQAVAAWSILYVEGRRSSNQWRIVSFVTCWGLAIQTGAFALIMPIHLLIHLSTSPTVSSKKEDDFHVDIPQMQSIPFSLAVGFVVPAVALALPAPSVLTYDQKQIWIATWQVFPLWVEILQQTISYLFAKLSSSSTMPTRKPPDRQQPMRALRAVYIFVLVVAGVTRISTLAITFTSHLFPSLFSPEFRGVLAPANVFPATSIMSSKKVTSTGEGASLFLLYDEMVGSSALLVWAAALYTKKYNEVYGLDRWTGLKMVTAASGLQTLFGPCGLAVALYWARDELVFERRNTSDKKVR